jgi:basic amino acid/polyamine antiporter, APA family
MEAGTIAGHAARAGALSRRLGAVDGAALIVSNVVGVGIFTTPGIVAGMLPGAGWFLGVWIAGGILALIGGLVYAELGGAYPEAGGEYVYIREAFGAGAAFLSGWTSLVAGFAGAIAAAAVGFAIYLGRIVPTLGDESPLASLTLGPLAVEVTPPRVLALALIGLLTMVHVRGLGPGRRVQNALAALSVATILALVAAGLALPARNTPALPWPDSPASGGGPFLALVLVMFTYSGWNAATYVAGELRAPGRTLHAAVLSGTLLVTVLYLGLNLLYLRTVPFAALETTAAVADAAAGAVFGRWSGQIVAGVVGLALASGVSAMLLAGPRIYFAMARDGVLPCVFGRLRQRAGVPAFGVAAQAVWAGVLVLTGTFEELLTYTGFAVVLFSGAAVASLFVLRRRPGFRRRHAIHAWGYPWAPALFLLASAAMLIQAVRFAPGPSLAGASLIAAGVPLYLWSRSRAGRRAGLCDPVSADAFSGEIP